MVESTAHAHHDRFAIAAALGAGVRPPTLAVCSSCAALHRDLLAIQMAIRHAWTPRRPRDLRLRRADIVGREPTLWRRMLERFTTPVAIGLTTLGIAGFVVANVPPTSASLTRSAEGGRDGAFVAPPASAPSDHARNVERPTPDPLIVVSSVSVAAGGVVLGLRRVTSRGRSMR